MPDDLEDFKKRIAERKKRTYERANTNNMTYLLFNPSKRV